jgi:predicted transcriptional regulator
MFVKGIMLPKFKCFTVQQEERLQKVLQVMEEHQIDGLPVLNGNQYLGIDTRYKIYEEFFSSGMEKADFLQTVKAKDIAINMDKYLTGEETFESTLLQLKDFPCWQLWVITKNSWVQ